MSKLRINELESLETGRSLKVDKIDSDVRLDLANPDKGAGMVARGVVAVDSIVDLLALPVGVKTTDKIFAATGYHANSNVGGGQFVYDPSLAGINDGGVIFSGFRRLLGGQVVSAEMFGCRGDVNGFDSAPYMQTYVNWAIANGGRTIFIPFDNSQKYLFNSTVIIEVGGFAVTGNALGGNMGSSYINGGHITGGPGLSALFDYGNNAATNPASNRVVFSGVAFKNTNGTTSAIKVSRAGDGPDRDILFFNTTGYGFVDAVLFDAPAGNTLSGATVTFQNSYFLQNTGSAVNALDRLLGFRYVGNMSEAGGQVRGKIDGPVTITDNMLEGQPNALELVGMGAAKALIGRNYYERNSGDFIIKFMPTAASATLQLVDDFFGGQGFSATDFCAFNGGRLIDSRVSSPPPVTIKGCSPGSKLLNTIWVRAGDDTPGAVMWCDPAAHRGQQPAQYTVTIWTDIGAVSESTPFGNTDTAATYTGTVVGTGSTISTLPYTAGDIIVGAMLVKASVGSSPQMALYNTTDNGNLDPRGGVAGLGGSVISTVDAGWHLVTWVVKTDRAGAGVRSRFSAGVADKTITVAGFGAYVIPAADFITRNSHPRAVVKLFVPF